MELDWEERGVYTVGMMRSPTTVYAGVGFLVGAFSGLLIAGAPDFADLLIGAFIGVFIGILLAMSKYKLWDRR